MKMKDIKDMPLPETREELLERIKRIRESGRLGLICRLLKSLKTGTASHGLCCNCLLEGRLMPGQSCGVARPADSFAKRVEDALDAHGLLLRKPKTVQLTLWEE